MGPEIVYVSITGLELKAARHSLRFWWHAIRSMGQARGAPGNISADARTINGVHHTRSVWTDETAMRHYLITGAHRGAIKAFHNIATGKTLGFSTDQVPDWGEVHELWRTQDKPVFSRKSVGDREVR
jgi:hypothetical protein